MPKAKKIGVISSGLFEDPSNPNKPMGVFGAQSFTSLKADLWQDINGGFWHLAGALIEHFLEDSAPVS